MQLKLCKKDCVPLLQLPQVPFPQGSNVKAAVDRRGSQLALCKSGHIACHTGWTASSECTAFPFNQLQSQWSSPVRHDGLPSRSTGMHILKVQPLLSLSCSTSEIHLSGRMDCTSSSTGLGSAPWSTL